VRTPVTLFRAACLVAAVILCSAPAAAQQGEGDYEITDLSIVGNATFPTGDLIAQLTTRETPGFVNKFFYNTISERLGRKNEYYNSVTISADLERLRKYYHNRGFLDVAVDTALAFDISAHDVGITIRIAEGPRSLIDSLSFRGIVNTPVTVGEDIESAPKIVQGDPFNRLLLEEEVKRVLRVLNNNGYPHAEYVRDSSVARRFASNRDYTVVLTFHPGKRYIFGPITIRQEVDSLRGAPYRYDITDDILLQQLDYQPGDFYSLENKISSERNLNRLGIFDLRQIELLVPPQSDSAVAIPSVITIRPRDKHELAPELIVSNENDALNLGTGIGYTNRNFLGGARMFSTRLRFRTQTLAAFPRYFVKNSNAVSNLDLTFEMIQPYVFSNKVKGSWSFSFILDKQKPYLQNIVRNKFGFTDRFAEFTNGYLDWTLEALSLSKNEYFVGAPNDPETQKELRLLQEQQFNSIITFTIQRDKSNDLFSPSEGFIHSATIEEAGVLPSLLEKALPRLPFTQFYSGSLLGRWYFDVSGQRFSVVALKLKLGLEEKYGESRGDSTRGIPQTHRFYAGGGGSVRGWNSRDLIASGDPQLGGNLSFEGSVELRTNLLQGLHDGVLDKIWLVEFIDFGNVWGEIRQFRIEGIGLAAGFGFRYDTFFGPFRIDWGFRIYNPAEAGGQRWITQRKLVGQTFKEGVFHFGIGHAF
jgi:outer membrane protein insertion porin family